jgi:starvation-inducible outer membrane lipoprotein
MSRSILALLVLVLVMLSGCITLPRDVASELEPVAHHRQDHFRKL